MIVLYHDCLGIAILQVLPILVGLLIADHSAILASSFTRQGISLNCVFTVAFATSVSPQSSDSILSISRLWRLVVEDSRLSVVHFFCYCLNFYKTFPC